MAAFDPDVFLATTAPPPLAFDPDAFLRATRPPPPPGSDGIRPDSPPPPPPSDGPDTFGDW